MGPHTVEILAPTEPERTLKVWSFRIPGTSVRRTMALMTHDDLVHVVQRVSALIRGVPRSRQARCFGDSGIALRGWTRYRTNPVRMQIRLRRRGDEETETEETLEVVLAVADELRKMLPE